MIEPVEGAPAWVLAFKVVPVYEREAALAWAAAD